MHTTTTRTGLAAPWRPALTIALSAVLALLMFGWLGLHEAAAQYPIDTEVTILDYGDDPTCSGTPDCPDPSVVGQAFAVEFQVAVTGDNPDHYTPYGTLTVDDGHGGTCQRTVTSDLGDFPNGWEWQCSLSSSVAGNLTLTATFVPLEPDKFNGDSDTEPHQVLKADTTTVLTSSPNPSGEGQSVTLTATVAAVSPGGGTPVGTVSFYADGELLGTATLNGSGVASLSTSTLAVGTHVLTAEYAGNANYYGSESTGLTQAVLDADLKIVKMVKPDGEVRAGETVVYTVLVDNLGPGAALNLVVDDTMIGSGSYTVQSIAPDHGGSCTPAAPVSSSGTNNEVAIECSLAELEAHGRWTIVVSAVANETIDINNVASVYAELPSDPNLENNYADGAIAVTDVADLSVSKTEEYPLCAGFYDEWDGSSEEIELDVPCAGRPLTYTLTVMNSGPSTAENVVLEELLPVGVTVASVSPDQGSCTTGIPGDPFAPLVCNLGNLLPDTSTTVVVWVEIDEDLPLTECGDIVVSGIPVCVAKMENDAFVSSDIFDDDNGNNRASLVLDVYGASGLEVSKTAFPDLVQAGEDLHYTVTITNLGPSVAQGVIFTDRLPGDPGDLTLTSFDFLRGGGTCTYVASLNAVRCSVDDIPVWDQTNPQLEVVLHFIADPGVDDATAWDNCLLRWDDWAASSFIFPKPHDVCAATTLQSMADLAIAKTSEPAKVYPGEQIKYTISVTNNGPSSAAGVVVADTLPISAAYEIDNGNCDLVSQNPDVLECYLGDMVPGETEIFDVWALVDADAPPGEITNAAVVNMSYDTNADNNTASASNLVLVPVVADLSLVKYIVAPPPAPFYAGNNVCFRLAVTNDGPSTAENVVLEDMLPVGVTVVNVEPQQGSCTTGTPGSTPVTCDLGTLGVDATLTIDVLLNIDPDYMGTLENDAVVSSDTFDPDNGNNRDSVIVSISTLSEVFMKKGCGWEEDVLAGEEIQYDILVRNDGPSTAHNYEFWDLLPDDVTYLSYEMLPSGGGECSYTPQLPPMHGGPGQGLHCMLGDVGPSETRVVYLRVRVNADASEGLLTNEITDWAADSNVSLTGSSDDLYCSNNVVNEADLSIRKWAEPWKVFAGEQVMYTIEVANNGPGNAYGVLVTDTLPSGVLAELVTDPACVITGEFTGEEVDCYWDVLPVGQTKSFYIFGRVEPDAEPGTVSNGVDVWSEVTADPVDYNDYSSAPILIQSRADLKVQKFGKPEGEVRAGDELTYTVIVENLGTGYAHGVTLDDVMESDGSFDLLEVTSNRDALCDPETGTFDHEMSLTCTLSDTLEVKGPEPGSGRWMLTVVVAANEPQDINNVASVTGADYDPDLSNNEAMAEHEITAVADLELVKEAWGEMLVGCEGETELWLDEVAAGNTVTYTLTVTNLGPSTAENVTVLDEPLPYPDLLNIDVESIEASQGECLTADIVDERRLSCNLGTIAPEMTATVTFVASVPSWVPDYTVLVNDAQVYSDMFDDNNGNDQYSNQTIVSRVADLEVIKTQDPEISLPTWDITYTITVTNLGPSDVEGLFISDTIPVEVLDPVMTCCASDDGECDIPCEPPTCPVEPCPWPDIGLYAQANIPAGEWVIYTVNGTVDWWPCGPFTNTVTLIPPESLTYPPEDIDPCDENNTDIAVNDPVCHFDPLVLKSFPGPDSTD